nr:hypothetical protein OH837_39110 [Streptomyces canus]
MPYEPGQAARHTGLRLRCVGASLRVAALSLAPVTMAQPLGERRWARSGGASEPSPTAGLSALSTYVAETTGSAVLTSHVIVGAPVSTV